MVLVQLLLLNCKARVIWNHLMTLAFSSFCGREPHEDMRVAEILIMRARHSGLGACLSDNVE